MALSITATLLVYKGVKKSDIEKLDIEKMFYVAVRIAIPLNAIAFILRLVVDGVVDYKIAFTLAVFILFGLPLSKRRKKIETREVDIAEKERQRRYLGQLRAEREKQK